MFFLYHKTTRPTGRVLAKALGFQHFGLKTPANKPDLLLRWGNAMPVVVDPGREINSTASISRASDKLRAFQTWKEAGVAIPWFTTSQAEAEDRRANGSTIFGRTRHGSKGRGIVVYPADVDGGYHNDGGDCPAGHHGPHELYSEYIPNTREYRLHVVGDSVVRIQRKYPTRENAAAHIKNHEAGFVFKAPKNGLNRSRTDLAVSAVKSLGLDFGAVDLVIDAGGIAYVLEVNTAPACSPLTGQAYVTALSALVAERSGGQYAPPVDLGQLQQLAAPGDEQDVRREAIFVGTARY